MKKQTNLSIVEIDVDSSLILHMGEVWSTSKKVRKPGDKHSVTSRKRYIDGNQLS